MARPPAQIPAFASSHTLPSALPGSYYRTWKSTELVLVQPGRLESTRIALVLPHIDQDHTRLELLYTMLLSAGTHQPLHWMIGHWLHLQTQLRTTLSEDTPGTG